MSFKIHEAECIDSQQDQLFDRDDFWGDSIDARWNITNSGTGTVAVVDGQSGGIIRLSEPANSDYSIVNWGNIRSLHVNKKVTIEFKVTISVDNADRYLELQLRFDGDNYIMIRVPASGSANVLRCVNNGVQTSVAGSTIADTDPHIYRIECLPSGEVHFFIDNVEEPNSPITTNIPNDAGDFLQPYIYGSNLNPGAGGGVDYDIDYVGWRQDI